MIGEAHNAKVNHLSTEEKVEEDKTTDRNHSSKLSSSFRAQFLFLRLCFIGWRYPERIRTKVSYKNGSQKVHSIGFQLVAAICMHKEFAAQWPTRSPNALRTELIQKCIDESDAQSSFVWTLLSSEFSKSLFKEYLFILSDEVGYWTVAKLIKKSVVKCADIKTMELNACTEKRLDSR